MYKYLKEIFAIIFLTPVFLSIIFKIDFRPSVFGQEIYFNLMEVFIVFSFFTVGLLELFGEAHKNRIESNNSWYIFIFSVFLILIGFGTGVYFSDDKISGFGFLKSYFLIPAMYFYLIYNFSRSRERVEDLIYLFGFSGIFSLFYILFFFLFDFWENSRLKGFYESPNYLSIYLVPVFVMFFMIFILSLFDRKMRGKMIFYFSGIVSLISLISIFLTKSRSGILIVILMILFSILLKTRKVFKNKISTFDASNKNSLPDPNSSKLQQEKTLKIMENKYLKSLIIKRAIILGSLLTVFFGMIFLENQMETRIENSDNIRKTIWKNSIEIIKDNPIFGVGIDDFKTELESRIKNEINAKEFIIPNAPHPHNLFLNIWLNLGLFGLFGFILMIFSLISKNFHFLKSIKNHIKMYELSEKNLEKNKKMIVHEQQYFNVISGITMAFISILIYGLLDNVIWKNDLMIQFSVLIALNLIIIRHWVDISENV